MAQSDSPSCSTLRGTIGLLLVRVVVPLWVLAGALFKLWERNPKLLPGPVRDVSVSIATWLNVAPDDFGIFLDNTLRFLIGTEFALVLVMIFVPRLARITAILVLSLFVLVLTGVLLAGGDNCGCFGTGGPPPWAMLLIDLGLLLGVILCPPCRQPSRTALLALAAVGGLAAFGVAFMVPNPKIAAPSGEPVAVGEVEPAPTPPTPSTDAGTAPAGERLAAAAASAWPAAPAPKTTYFPQTAEWIGKPLREIDLAQQMSRPLPGAIDQGGWYVIFYRGDCEHCHALLADHLSKHAERTIAARVPDTDPASDQPMPPGAFHMHTLPEGPNYVFQTPLLLAVLDGSVVALCTDSEDEAMVAQTLAAAPATKPAAGSGGGSGVKPNQDLSQTTSHTPGREPAPAQPAAKPSTPVASGWPAAPAPATTYFPQLESWKGQRLDAQPLALQIKPPPSKINSGRWHVVLYRGDCDHCHALMEDHLVGDIESRVLAVRVPDTDPAADLGMPLQNATMATFLEGPNYVFSTPVLLTLVDGVIVGMALDSENEEEVKACLAAGAK